MAGTVRTFFLLVFYYPMEKIGALHFITYILSLSETPSFSIHDHHTSLIRLYNLRFQRAVRNTFVRLVRIGIKFRKKDSMLHSRKGFFSKNVIRSTENFSRLRTIFRSMKRFKSKSFLRKKRKKKNCIDYGMLDNE